MTNPPLAPRLEILPAPQRRLWDELIDVPDDFTLYGGTALALHVGHRESVDFDFFGSSEFDPDNLLASVPFLEGAQVLQRALNTLTVLVDRGGPVQVSFFGVPRIGRIDEAHIVENIGLKIAGLRDLAGMKASVVQKRAEAKDYIDLDALIQQGIPLPVALAAAQEIYGEIFNPQITLKALTYFGEGNLTTLPAELKDRLTQAVRAVDLDQLPKLTPAVARRDRRPNP